MFLRRDRLRRVRARARSHRADRHARRPAATPSAAELRQRFGRRKRARPHVVLRLQPSEVVQSRIDVPAAARDVMEPVLRHQIERLAPWPADKALLAYEIAGPGGAAGNARRALTITGRPSGSRALVGELDGLGYRPDVVDFGTDAEGEPRLNLLPASRAIERPPHGPLASELARRRLRAGAARLEPSGCIRPGAEHARAERASRQARGAARRRASRSGRRRVLRASERQALLAAEKLVAPPPLIMLEALSRALPDDAWLDRLEVGQGSVRLVGNATNAAAIIGRIEASAISPTCSSPLRPLGSRAKTTRASRSRHRSLPGKELEP